MPVHLIVGGGPAATNAVETIRQLDGGDSRIVLVSDEPAHSRMALPYWLAGKITREHTYTGDDAYFSRLGVEARLGRRVTALDVASKRAELDDGTSIEFDNLLLATGASPIRPELPGADLPGVLPMWTLAHAERALQVLDGKAEPRVVLVGAGFIGFIVLNALFKRGCRLAVVEREQQVLPRMLDPMAAHIVEQWLRQRKVDVRCGTTVTQIEAQSDGTKRVFLANGENLTADLVVLAVGIRPNVELARAAGLEIDPGILVNEKMQTSVPFVYAGGDVAQGPVLGSTKREIHAIQPTAVDHGRVAGANMAGREVRYPGSLAMNVVDVCGLQTASFGRWDSGAEHEMVIHNAADKIYRKLVWEGDRIVGAIFIGRAEDMGLLTDVGMVKGMIQTQASLGIWKNYLEQNPFDIRRAFVGAGIAQRLLQSTLLGMPSRPRGYQPAGEAQAPVGSAHRVYVSSRHAVS
ncbi:MAG: NADH oxidase [Pirellulaceae bacterium]|nr:MAG: NADH oxidase [Pirellulaceae bacterium]